MWCLVIISEASVWKWPQVTLVPIPFLARWGATRLRLAKRDLGTRLGSRHKLSFISMMIVLSSTYFSVTVSIENSNNKTPSGQDTSKPPFPRVKWELVHCRLVTSRSISFSQIQWWLFQKEIIHCLFQFTESSSLTLLPHNQNND